MCFIRLPLRFTSSSLPLRVWYYNHFSLQTVHASVHGVLIYNLSTCTASWGLEDDLFDSLQNTPLTGIIFWPLFTSFCSCFVKWSLSKNRLFCNTWYCTGCFFGKMFSHIHCNFLFITFLTIRNCLWHSPQLHLLDVSLLFSNVWHILCMFQHMVFHHFSRS